MLLYIQQTQYYMFSKTLNYLVQRMTKDVLGVKVYNTSDIC